MWRGNALPYGALRQQVSMYKWALQHTDLHVLACVALGTPTQLHHVETPGEGVDYTDVTIGYGQRPIRLHMALKGLKSDTFDLMSAHAQYNTRL